MVILTDIEGTTTPISFVKDILFPYVLDNMHAFLERNWSSPDMQNIYLPALKSQADADIESAVPNAVPIPPLDTGKEEVLTAIIDNIKWQMSIDRKIKALKDFQGYMWREGYESGELKGIVYQDVVDAFDNWQQSNRDVYIYSSGSIAAQKLIFGHSDRGNLLPKIKGHFDTSIGSKLEAGSYERIAREIGVESVGDILFLSDNPKELVAASNAGMKIALVIRPGNQPLDSQSVSMFPTVFSFDEIPQ